MKKQSQNKIDALTNNDLQKIANLLDKQLSPLATKESVNKEIKGVKEELNQSEQRIKTELKQHIGEGVETILKGIDNIIELLAEKERVEKLEKWVQRIGEKVGVKQG